MTDTQIRYAEYARTSTDNRQNPANSYDYQHTANVGRIEGTGVITVTYRDIETGQEWARDDFQRMLNDAMDHEGRAFDAVIVYDWDRFARWPADQEDAVRFLSSHGVQVFVAVSSISPTDRAATMDRRVRGIMDTVYIEELIRKVKDGMASSTRNNHHVGGRYLYGFMPDKYFKEDGSLDYVILVRNPETAPYVDLIFDLYDKGHSYREIAEKLNRDGVDSPSYYYWKKFRPDKPPSRENKWVATSVRAIIKNPRYSGFSVWGKQRKVRVFEDPLNIKESRKYEVWTDEEDWIWATESSGEGYISIDKYQDIASGFRARKIPVADSLKRSPHPKTLLGMVRCLSCGNAMQPSLNNSRPHYRCRLRDKGGNAGPENNGHPRTVYVREDKILPAIEDWFIKNIFSEDRLLILQDRFDTVGDPELRRREEEALRLEKQLTKLDMAEERYKAAIAEGIDPGRVRQWIREDAQTRKDIVRRVAELRKPVNDVHELADILKEIPDLSQQLLSAPPDLKRELFQAFGLRCVWDHENKRLKVSVRPAAFFVSNPGSPTDPGDNMCTKWCRRGDSNPHGASLH
jgi:site-specific DNA recombinase